jgi:hypothetical protein
MMLDRRHLLAASVLISALTGCAQPPRSASSAQDGAPAREDQLPRFIGVIGAKTQHAPPFLGVPGTNYYCLRSFVDRKTGETLHQLYVSDSYSGNERRWEAARDDGGRPLRFVEIGRNEISCTGSCSYLEEFAAAIPESELRADPQGLAVIFASASGAEKRIMVSGAQISAQLAAVEARRGATQPAAAAQPTAPHQ